MEWCNRRTKHKFFSKVFEVWMLANAYKGSRTYDTTAAVLAVAINIVHKTEPILRTIEINEKKKESREAGRH